MHVSLCQRIQTSKRAPSTVMGLDSAQMLRKKAWRKHNGSFSFPVVYVNLTFRLHWFFSSGHTLRWHWKCGTLTTSQTVIHLLSRKSWSCWKFSNATERRQNVSLPLCAGFKVSHDKMIGGQWLHTFHEYLVCTDLEQKRKKTTTSTTVAIWRKSWHFNKPLPTPPWWQALSAELALSRRTPFPSADYSLFPESEQANKPELVANAFPSTQLEYDYWVNEAWLEFFHKRESTKERNTFTTRADYSSWIL